MAKEAMNRIHLRRFVERCKGGRVTSVNVERQEKGSQVLFRYHAKAPRGRQRLNGEWVVSKKEREEADVAEREKSFLDELRKDFAVRKVSGFSKLPVGEEVPASEPEGSED